MTITVDIPASFSHHATIYVPHNRPPDDKPRFGITLPALPVFADCNIRTQDGRGVMYPEPIVYASSHRPPVIMVGDGSNDECAAWFKLCGTASRYRIPLDKLLINRPLKVACELWTPNGRMLPSTPKQAINLIGVQILGDFTKSPLLDQQIAEIKSWFNEGDDE